MVSPIAMSDDAFRRELGDGLVLRWSTADDTERLVQLYLATGQKEKAAAWRKKLEARREADKKAEKPREK